MALNITLFGVFLFFYIAPSNSACIFKTLITVLLLAFLFHSSELSTLFNSLLVPEVLVSKDHISSLALISHCKCDQTTLKQLKLSPAKVSAMGELQDTVKRSSTFCLCTV